ncbi:MAG: membrane protein DedA with SNARE-associated domain [Polaribacter sp.]|jgi:membrane protein DedA with SNARE-associated domain
MEPFTDYLLHAIQNHTEWAWLVVFLIAFAESLAIIGIMVPGWLLLVGIGTLIGTNVLSFYPIVFSAYVGAVLGEYLSYILGYHYHQSILDWRLFKSHQALLEKAKIFFERYGTAGVFFGRFVGPLRAVIPFSAGVFQMKKSTFTWVNLTSGIIWAPLYLTPGILAGAAYKLDKQTGIESVLIILLITLMGWYAYKQGLNLFSTKRIEDKINASLLSRRVNFILAIFIFVISNVVLIKSHYFDFLKALFKILFS